jgi:hypothetical protein
VNLSKSPTREQMRDLIGSADDNAANHVLWVGFDGDVHLDALEADESPIAFEERRRGEMKFRGETMCMRNDYAGAAAAASQAYVDNTLAWLVRSWKKGATGLVDL